MHGKMQKWLLKKFGSEGAKQYWRDRNRRQWDRLVETLGRDGAKEHWRGVIRRKSQRRKARRNGNPFVRVRWLLWRARNRAKKRGIEATTRFENLVVPTHCPVLGIRLIYDGTGSGNAASLDRWDNSKGYVPGNVFVISARANKLKNDATLDEMRRIVAYMEHAPASSTEGLEEIL